MKVSVNNSHVRHELIVSKRIFYTGCFISNYRKRSNFASCTGRSRNSNEVSLFAHLGEGVYTFADINKTHCHIHEVCVRMLIKYPHNLCSVHCASAADSDDYIRCECSHLSRTFLSAGKSRVGSNIVKCCVNNAHAVKLVGYRFCISIVVKEAVSYYKRFLFAHNGL